MLSRDEAEMLADLVAERVVEQIRAAPVPVGRYLTTGELARALNVSTSWVMSRKAELGAIPLSGGSADPDRLRRGKYRWDFTQASAYLESLKVEGTDPAREERPAGRPRSPPQPPGELLRFRGD
jgi:hypothetical protein